MGQFTKYSINTVLTSFVTMLASGGMAIITARILGPEGKGQLTLILLIPMLATVFGRMGIGHAVNYYAPRIPATKLIINSFVSSFCLSLLVVAVSAPIVYALKDLFFKTIDEKLITLITFFIPFYIFNNHFIGLLQGFYKINFRNLILIGQAVLNLVLLILLLVFLKLGIGGAVVAAVTSVLFSVFFAAFIISKDIKPKDVALDFNFIKKLFNFGFKSHIGNILKDITYRGDILIISYFLSPASVGFYIIAVTVAEIIWNIPNAVGSVLLPKVAQMDSKEVRSFTPMICRIVLLPVLIACTILFLFGKDIISFAFGEQFVPSSTALVILLPGIVFFTVWKIIANDLIAQGYPAKYSLTSGLALVTMLVLDLLLIPRFGINGAALASTISYASATVLIVYIYAHITNNSLKDLIVPRWSDVGFYMGFFKMKGAKAFISRTN